VVKLKHSNKYLKKHPMVLKEQGQKQEFQWVEWDLGLLTDWKMLKILMQC
jgi:hypothetical protein